MEKRTMPELQLWGKQTRRFWPRIFKSGPSGRRKHHRDLIQADVSVNSGVAQMGSIASDVVLSFGPPLGSGGKDAL